MVDPVDDSQVDALGRRRDQDAFGARVEMLLGRFAICEKTGAFKGYVDLVLAVRQVRRVAFGSDLDALAVDDEIVALGADRARIGAVDRVALEQQSVGFGVREIVDRHQLQPAVAPFEDRAGHQAADPPETVDRNSGGHVIDLPRVEAPRLSAARWPRQ